MSLFSVFLIGIGLSMDACAVSFAKGICLRRQVKTYALKLGLAFGLFQALMPLIGWWVGTYFESFATSIDALAVGISFAFLKVDIIPAVCLIGITTFIISCIAVFLGNKIGGKLGKYAEITGGVILILIGLKILIEHLFGL